MRTALDIYKDLAAKIAGYKGRTNCQIKLFDLILSRNEWEFDYKAQEECESTEINTLSQRARKKAERIQKTKYLIKEKEKERIADAMSGKNNEIF